MEALPGWNKALDLMMETGGEEGITDAVNKRRREEGARGWRKQRKEDDI